MTITATETGIKITGSPPVSISSIVITDDNDVESTLDMSDISSDGLESIYSDTGYSMSLGGIFNGFSAFYDPSISLSKGTTFKINFIGASNGRLTAYKDRGGTFSIQLLYDPEGGTDYIAFPMTNARFEFKAGDDCIDTDGDYAEITDDGFVTFKPGGLDLEQNDYWARIVLYNDDYPDGTVIAGPGKSEIIYLQYFVK